MGKQRHKTIQIVVFLTFLLVMLSFIASGCSINKRETSEGYATAWVKKQVTIKGEPKYPNDAIVMLSAQLTVTLPEVDAFRGSIISQEKQWNGVFFIHKKNHTIQFHDTNNP